MDDKALLKPIRELLETIRERVDYAIIRLKSFEEVRSLAWRCETCGHVKKFTRKAPSHLDRRLDYFDSIFYQGRLEW
jgi:hypothetical protein